MGNRKSFGVMIDDIHTFQEYGLIMTDKKISTPVAKLKMVDVPGRNGSVDMSEVATGDVRYNDRTIELKFVSQEKVGNWEALLSEMRNQFCGRKCRYVFDDDIAFYWSGRCTDISMEAKEAILYVNMKITVDPYKYTIQSTAEDWLWDPFDFEQGVINETGNLVVNGTLSVEIIGLKKYVNPIIVSNANMSVVFNGKTYDVKAGSQVMYGIVLTEGTDTLQFKGNGTVSINYVGGSL